MVSEALGHLFVLVGAKSNQILTPKQIQADWNA